MVKTVSLACLTFPSPFDLARVALSCRAVLRCGPRYTSAKAATAKAPPVKPLFPLGSRDRVVTVFGETNWPERRKKRSPCLRQAWRIVFTVSPFFGCGHCVLHTHSKEGSATVRETNQSECTKLLQNYKSNQSMFRSSVRVQVASDVMRRKRAPETGSHVAISFWVSVVQDQGASHKRVM